MKRILVAEDDPASRELLLDILEGLGYEAVVTSNGEEALRKIEEAIPDLVLLDIQMPVLDGFAVLRRLRQDARFCALPVLALTAYTMREDREKILQAGFDDHIPKPVDVSLLRLRIEQYLGARAEC